MKYFPHVLLCAALLGAACVPAVADDLVNKPPSTTNPHGGQISVSNAPNNTFAYYDQFSLAGASTITDVAWSESIQYGSLYTPYGFDISFYSNTPPDMMTSFYDNPGTLLYSAYVDLSHSHEVDVPASDYGTDPTHVYHIIDLDAAVSFDATQGGTYWISIVTNAFTTTGYTWQASDAGTDNEGRRIFDPRSGFVSYGGPVAFDLTGTPDVAMSSSGTPSATPEPSSLVLMGSGMLGLAGAMRKRIFAR